MQKEYNVVIVGGGAAGFFTAINIAKQRVDLKIAIFERGKDVLQKVKVSGGGRCNVTHACFDPKELTQYYPRGEKELLGPFHQFACGDTFEWFDQQGIELKIEEDGRIFPVTDSSQTIIDCFQRLVKKYNIEVLTNTALLDFKEENGGWIVETKSGEIAAGNLVIAAGSSPKLWKLLKAKGIAIVNPVPSLFTFNINDERLTDIPGVVVQDVEVSVLDTKLESNGPLLVTHWGLSAPSVLKLSAWGARVLADKNYQFQIKINFIGLAYSNCLEQLHAIKKELAKNVVAKYNQFDLPKRLWRKLITASKITDDVRWADINKTQIENLASQLTEAVFSVNGKSTFKEEFVTAGGVDLKEINFKRFESKKYSNLFFAGEILNIDAVTGGFNFQNAWTGGYLIAKAISEV
ncbi:BaiN/RdsA family NAD(P)/FAD-dependent oxidoreductase [Pseudofulvibacter geojedonensis]|uniref:NAD(P)/FAD-dependent oxidoreductase n=1 Tax=Pseudofulvibacter geojedonensis TaxID=1123758 RepID=A0ABW3I5P2_9FLAO